MDFDDGLEPVRKASKENQQREKTKWARHSGEGKHPKVYCVSADQSGQLYQGFTVWFKTNNLSARRRRQTKIKTPLVPVHLQSLEATSYGPENLTGGTATNDTTTQPMSLGFGITLICISIVTFIVGFIGNGLVIFLTGCRMKTTVNSIWFLNLAIADFLFILSFIIIEIIPYFLPYNSFMDFVHMTIALYMLASIFCLVVISLDRCLCTWMPVWAQNNRTVFRARIICIIVWVLSIACCIPFFFVPDVFLSTFPVTYKFLVGFVIPFLIIASSHIAIGVRIKHLKMGKQLRSYRVIIAVILAFFICCFPYYVCSLFLQHNAIAMAFSVYLFFLNSCLNPILYVFMCDEYKKKLKQSLLLVLETAFAEDHLDFRGKQIQRDEQNQTNTFKSVLDK
ncbi:C3a anaphylatoxin chemotactic receptor-like [Pseudorasbora parva]|uniref:C3a anaphylatoxin chemotactic receptor-like n=1 Tax=Pseudorasbora parva TaxID=51549 RepID=UPI00351F457F